MNRLLRVIDHDHPLVEWVVRANTLNDAPPIGLQTINVRDLGEDQLLTFAKIFEEADVADDLTLMVRDPELIRPLVAIVRPKFLVIDSGDDEVDLRGLGVERLVIHRPGALIDDAMSVTVDAINIRLRLGGPALPKRTVNITGTTLRELIVYKEPPIVAPETAAGVLRLGFTMYSISKGLRLSDFPNVKALYLQGMFAHFGMGKKERELSLRELRDLRLLHVDGRAGEIITIDAPQLEELIVSNSSNTKLIFTKETRPRTIQVIPYGRLREGNFPTVNLFFTGKLSGRHRALDLDGSTPYELTPNKQLYRKIRLMQRLDR